MILSVVSEIPWFYNDCWTRNEDSIRSHASRLADVVDEHAYRSSSRVARKSTALALSPCEYRIRYTHCKLPHTPTPPRNVSWVQRSPWLNLRDTMAIAVSRMKQTDWAL